MKISKVCIPVLFAGLATLFASFTYAGPPIQSMTIECNWGTLTMEMIKEQNFDQEVIQRILRVMVMVQALLMSREKGSLMSLSKETCNIHVS